MGTLLGGQDAVRFEKRYLVKDGRTVWVDASIALLRDAHDRPEHFIATLVDISERRRALDELAQSEARYRLLAENVSDVIWTADLGLRFTYVSPSQARLCGFTAAETLAMTADQLLTPASFQRAQEVLREELQAEARGGGDPARTRTLEVEQLRKDGGTLRVEVKVGLLRGSDGTPVGLLGVTRDVTERRRVEEELRVSEQRFRTLVESMDDAVITVDRGGHVTSLSAKYLDRLGFAVSTIVGKTATEVFGPEAGARHDAAHVRVMAGEHVVFDWSFLAQGEVRYMQTAASPLHDHQGQVVGAVRVSRDVTETRKIHEQLLLSERMTSMGTLAAGVAHEINNPLAATMANLEFARRELGPLRDRVPSLDEILDALKDASETADRVRQIVRDLKVFSRADEERRAPVDVRLVLESAVRMVGNEIRHRATLQRKYDDVPPVLANEARLGQVFLNLLVNAAQAIPEGHADANVIGLRVATDAPGRVVVEVRDTGAGIPPAVRDHVFEPFYTTKPVGVGTGLGLAICQRIVAEMGGEIALDSEVGEGTTVRVRLPAATAAAAAALPVPTPLSRRRGSILVVDDEPSVGRAIARALGPFHQVATVRSGREALTLLQAEAAFDVILCDVMMPEMTGAELHEELSRTMPETAATMIFMTGGAFTPAAAEFLDRVPNERVEKPLDMKSLLALIGRRLR
jgi:PAS domain S-box-containing protein